MINWSRVEELRDEIGDEDFAEVAEMFMEEVEAVILRLRSGRPMGRLEEELHSLKGSALNLGFGHLAELCQEGERRAANGDFHSFRPAAIVIAYEKSRQEFFEMLNRNTPAAPHQHQSS